MAKNKVILLGTGLLLSSAVVGNDQSILKNTILGCSQEYKNQILEVNNVDVLDHVFTERELNCGYRGFMIEQEKSLTEEEQKQEILNNETRYAKDYLNGNFNYEPIYKNRFSSKVKGLRLTMKISSKATLTTYNTIKSKVQFFSIEKSKIKEYEIEIQQAVAPNGSIVYVVDIEMTNDEYKSIKDFNWSILNVSKE